MRGEVRRESRVLRGGITLVCSGTAGAGWTSGGTDKGRKCVFGVTWKSLREWEMMVWGKVRFYVQGVTDCGVVLGWERCVYVDVGHEIASI
jgi:hypothetical protein